MKLRSLCTLLGTSVLALAAACGSDNGNGTGSCGDGHVTGSEACDDGNNVSGDGCSASCRMEGQCGNGVFDVSTEECDDGNTINGDGCSSSCDKEGTCGNGMVEPGETCDDGNTMASDGCNAVCSTENGFTCTGTPSVCSQGGGGGTCSSPSTISLMASGTDLVGTVMGDTSTATDALMEADCDGFTSGGGKDNIWTFTTTDVRDVIIAMTPDSTFDGSVRLMTAPCDINTQIVDVMLDGDGCSDSGYEGDPEYLGYVNLPAGTYYIAVDGYDSSFSGPYELSVTASEAGCGNGLLGNLEYCDDGNMTDGDGCTNCTVDTGYNCDQSEPSVCQAEGCGDGIVQDFLNETCDDDNTADMDGCSSTCTIETGYNCLGEPSVCFEKGCGNGFIEDAEECDDGNLVDNDRCDSSCVLEYDVTEMEPNNTSAQTLTAGDHIISATFDNDDIDLFTFTLGATSKVEIETYVTINGDGMDNDGVGLPMVDCPTDLEDTELAIFPMGVDTTMNANAMYIDDDDGSYYCSYLGPNDDQYDDFGDIADTNQLAALPAGTYTIRVQPSQYAGTIPAGTRYLMDIRIVPMGSAPVAPGVGDLKINEFLAADGGTTNGGVDSNCDGLLSNSDDEFIELVNVSNKSLDLTGVTYSDALGVKFTFAPQSNGSLTLAPNKAVVIWGGGNPQCPGVTNWFTNGTSHTLSLNDAGDTITIKGPGANPVTIATTTYTGSQVTTTAPRKSLNLSPDISGTSYVLHDAVAGASGNLSPGKKADGSAF